MEYSLKFHGTLTKSDVIKFHGIPWNLLICNWNDIRFPWTSMEFSIEFHGIPESPYQISQASHGIPWNYVVFHFKWHRVPWNSIELCRRQTKWHKVPWNSMELVGIHFKWHQGSMEFNRIFHGIPWSSAAAKSDVTQFLGIPWNFEIISLIDIRFPWTSIEYSMELPSCLIICRKVSWNSMELGDCWFKWHQVSLDFLAISYKSSRSSGVAISKITRVP